MEQLAAERACVGGGLQVLRSPDRPPARFRKGRHWISPSEPPAGVTVGLALTVAGSSPYAQIHHDLIYQRGKILKKVFSTLIVALALVIPTAASADNSASACGAVHGAFANTNGNFGFLGDAGGTPGYHGAAGQDPGATGYNNSHTDCQST